MNLNLMKGVAEIINRLGLEAQGLSHHAIQMLAEWKIAGKHQAVVKPSWDDYFLQLADDAADRSCDAQFHAGAVIVDRNHHIMSVGYNGFMAGIEDEWLPNIRPEKYPWMLHAELNAILNCEHKPRGATIYTNGHPCLHCFQCIVQAGISQVVFNTIRKATMIDEEADAKLEIAKWLARKKVTVREHNYKGKSNG